MWPLFALRMSPVSHVAPAREMSMMIGTAVVIAIPSKQAQEAVNYIRVGVVAKEVVVAGAFAKTSVADRTPAALERQASTRPFLSQLG
jgi:hypothetical protein